MIAARAHSPRQIVVDLLVACALLLAASSAFAGSPRSPEKPPQKSLLILDGLPDEEAREAREVYRVTRERFIELTGRKVGAIPVRVRLVERASGGEANRTVSQVMGTAIHGARECRISISVLRRGSFGRVLAHELTHAFLSEAYGRTANHALSEGLAEYLASLSYSSEVNRDMRAASAAYVNVPKLQPYVEGYNFCLHYARSPTFIPFFDRQVYIPDFGFDHLMTTWKRHAETPLP